MGRVLARCTSRQIESHNGKNIYIGEVHHKFLGNNEERPVVPVSYKITERLTGINDN